MLKTLAIIALGGGVAFLLARGSATISGEEAQRLVGDGATLLDVRSPGEFSSGHIEGAVNIPLDQLPARMDELGDREATVVLYCRSGQRSGRGLRLLADQGFTNLHNLGAMTRWPSP